MRGCMLKHQLSNIIRELLAIGKFCFNPRLFLTVVVQALVKLSGIVVFESYLEIKRIIIYLWTQMKSSFTCTQFKLVVEYY